MAAHTAFFGAQKLETGVDCEAAREAIGDRPDAVSNKSQLHRAAGNPADSPNAMAPRPRSRKSSISEAGV